MRTFKIITLGCKVNQAESEELRKRLLAGEWRPAADGQPADLCVVNTCAVTRRAAMQSRQALRRAAADHPEATLVASGCYAATDPQALEAIAGLDYIAGGPAGNGLVDALGPAPRGKPARPQRQEDAQERSRFDFLPPSPASGRTRPAIKIQDGCDAFCAYCIVPHARGRSRSMPFPAVLEALACTFDAGFHEVVLSGIHLGCWGRDLTPPQTLEDLLAAIAAHPPPGRVRLSSIEPLELSEALIDRIAGSACFCRHLHIPLQSGDEEVLRRMGRPYTPGESAQRIERVRRRMPDAAVGADLIVGFPGESEQAFENTLELIAALPVTYLHVFPFSPRPGTAAFGMTPRPSPPEVKRRAARLRRLGLQKRLAFHHAFVGREVEVLVETRRDPASGLLRGVSSNYLTVIFAGDDRLRNRRVRVRIEAAGPAVLSGALPSGAA
jgi:threonylcarbamoyladenosine tRNA methylthiotransferase MtaB